MSFLISSSRRRKLLFATAAIVAGGYASYRIYNSSAFARRRKRLLQILSTLSVCFEAVSESAESTSILLSDLKSFLLSDHDSIPQSLKQAFKIAQSEEFQGTVTVLSAALIRGLLLGVDGKPRKEARLHVCTHGPDQPVKPHFQALTVKDTDATNEDVACREIREVCFTNQTQGRSRNENDKDNTSLSNGPECPEWEMKNCSSGSSMQPLRSPKVDILRDKSRRGKPSEDWIDKLLSTLFSEPGKGFVSAVTGTLARNFVLAFFDTAHRASSSSKNSAVDSEVRISETTMEQKTIGYEKVIAVISTDPCRMLIVECMQTFISTAVTVYIEKTKDVNFYNDMLAGITNPSHRGPMKDVLTCVCNGAVETLVKTTYGVMVGENGLTHSPRLSEKKVCSPFSSWLGQQSSTVGMEACGTSSEDLVNEEQSDALRLSKSMGRLEGSGRVVQRFIDGVSKTLAIPSNRKLVVDVAGTMTSVAVKSFVGVVLHTASNHISSKMYRSWDRVKSCVLDQRGL